jgi:enamine deaminase RidA (YjgF/YER057c/UK114 family)
MLELAGMTVADIVKVTQYLTRAEDIPAYGKVYGIWEPKTQTLFNKEIQRTGFIR